MQFVADWTLLQAWPQPHPGICARLLTCINMYQVRLVALDRLGNDS